MPTKAEIVNQIEDQIIPNLMELITGGILQNVLLGMVDQINTLVGELDDLNTDDRSSIVNAINELVSNIQAIEDNLTPYVYFGIDDPNIVTPVGFGGDIPSFYVQQQHSGLDVVNIGFWTYTGIIGKEWVDLSLSSGGGSESFIELNDTPSSYTSQSRKKVRVKADETGLEFFDDYSELTDGTMPMFDEDDNTLKDSNLENTSTGAKVNGGIEADKLITNQQSSNAIPNTFWADNSGNPMFTNGAGISKNLASDEQVYKTISGNVTLDDSYFNAIVRITANAIITIPSTLRADFNCVFDAIGSVTGTFTEGSGVTFSSPFGKVLMDNGMCTIYKTSSSTYRLNGNLSVS